MDHSQFKANQTAAVYVADGLDGPTLEAFEIHMMACPECVEDVETWRAIKINMPAKVRPLATPVSSGWRGREAANWRMAASLVAVGALGATAGWFGHESQSPAFSSERTVFFNMPATERGSEECKPVPLSSRTRAAIVRISGISGGNRIVALNSDKRELPTDMYTVSVQPGGSQVMSINVEALVDRAVHLEARSSDGSTEPAGCVMGEIAKTG